MFKTRKEVPRKEKAAPKKAKAAAGTTRQTAKALKNSPNRHTLDLSSDQVFEMVRQRAFELYCQRGYQPGGEESDWLAAEVQVQEELYIR